MPLGEEFLHFEDFGALQVTELGGPAVDRTGGQGEHGDELGMAVALHDLGGKGGGFESEPDADLILDARIQMGPRPDRTAQFPHRDPLTHFDEALADTAKFIIHESQLEPEGDRFGMDAMAASHHGGQFVSAGLLGGRSADLIDAPDQKVDGRGHLHGERGVEDIRGSQSLVHPAGGGADRVRHILKEGDDIVVGPLFDLKNGRNGKLGLFADGLGVFLRDLSEARHGFAGESFDLEPDFVFALVGPEGSHLRPGISVNHPSNLAHHHARTNHENKKGRKPPGPDPACHEKLLELGADADPFQMPALTHLDATGLEKIDEGGHGLAAVFGGGADGGHQFAEGTVCAVEFAVGVEGFDFHTNFDHQPARTFKNSNGRL